MTNSVPSRCRKQTVNATVAVKGVSSSLRAHIIS